MQGLRQAPCHPPLFSPAARAHLRFPPSSPYRGYGSEGWETPKRGSNPMVHRNMFPSPILNFTCIRSSHMLHPYATHGEKRLPAGNPLFHSATGTSHGPNFEIDVVILQSCLDFNSTTRDCQCYFSCEFSSVWVSPV